MKKLLILLLAFIAIGQVAYAARDGSGNMSIPYPNFQPGTTISSSQMNSNFSNITSEITNSIPRDGQAAPTANIPMNGFKFTGMGDGSADDDSVTYGQLAAATTGLVTASSTNTFTNKTFDTGGSGNVFQIDGTQIDSISGNSSMVATTTGALTNGNCVSIDGNGNLVDAGAVCGGGGGSGTVNAGTAGQLGYYATSSTAISSNANLSISSGALTIGQAGSVIGTLKLSGNTSGTTTLTPAAAASGTLTLPAATDTLVGKATTDTFTNKTFDSTGSGNVLKLAGTTVTGASSILNTLGSTQGQLLYRNATGWTVLNPGTTGQVLTTLGAGANPQWSSSSAAMTLLNTVNASAASQIAFDATYITSAYNKYQLECDSLYTSDAGRIAFQISTNNGSSYLTGSYVAGYSRTSETGTATSAASDVGRFDISGDKNTSNTSTNVSQLHAMFSNPAASKHFDLTWDTFVNGSTSYDIRGSGKNSGTTATNAIRLYDVDGGNLTGNCHLYGLTGT